MQKRRRSRAAAAPRLRWAVAIAIAVAASWQPSSMVVVQVAAASFVSRPALLLAGRRRRAHRQQQHHPQQQQQQGHSSSDSSTTVQRRGCSVELVDPETNCRVVLVGCFHGSRSSAADVEAALLAPSSPSSGNNSNSNSNNDAPPTTDVVVLELCASRFADLRKDVEWQQQQQQQQQSNETKQQQQPQQQPWIQRYARMVRQTARSQGLPAAAAAALLGGVSGLQTALSNLEPGLEFTTATAIVARQRQQQQQQQTTDIILADQNVDTTLQKVGQLPAMALQMWRDCLFASPARGGGWDQTFGREARALRTALLGRRNNSANNNAAPPFVTLPAFLTRHEAARRDLWRLTVIPLLLLQLCNVAITQGVAVAAAASSSEDLRGLLADAAATATTATTTTALDSAADPVLMTTLTSSDNLAWMVAANAAACWCGYTTLALPAVRVVLRERDDQLADGIRAACRHAAAARSKTKNGGAARVVAVLGLLHVNGVAERLLLTPAAATTTTTAADGDGDEARTLT